MTQTPNQGPIVPVKPQPNVYTVLLIIALLAMAAAAFITYHDLTANYGMTFSDLFDPQYNPLAKQ